MIMRLFGVDDGTPTVPVRATARVPFTDYGTYILLVKRITAERNQHQKQGKR